MPLVNYNFQFLRWVSCELTVSNDINSQLIFRSWKLATDLCQHVTELTTKLYEQLKTERWTSDLSMSTSDLY